MLGNGFGVNFKSEEADWDVWETYVILSHKIQKAGINLS